MKNEKSPSHILLIILTIGYILFSNYMINQLENNVISKKIEIQNLKEEIQEKEMNLISCENKILEKEIQSIKEDKSEWKKFFITGYTANSGEQGTNEIVATMFNLDLNRVQNLPIIAVDPKIIPLYSIVEIKGLGVFVALDTGGLIKGNRIDILCRDVEMAYEITGEYLIRVLEKGLTLADYEDNKIKTIIKSKNY